MLFVYCIVGGKGNIEGYSYYGTINACNPSIQPSMPIISDPRPTLSIINPIPSSIQLHLEPSSRYVGGNPILTLICIRLAFIDLQYGNIAVDSILLVLGNAFCNPYNVADLLFLELDVRVKHAIVELLLECQAVQKHLVLKKLVFQCLTNS